MPDGTPPVPVANPVTDYVPSARPGGRAPHVWLQQRRRAQVSTIDLFGKGFVLLTGAKGAAWGDAARGPASAGHGPPALASADEWARTYGVDENGAVLVRPDGYVGWRSATAAKDPAAALGAAMAGILGQVTRS